MAIETTILFILKLSVIIIDIILFSVMLKKTIKIDLKITRRYFTGLSIFFVVHCICRTFYLLHSYFFTDIRIIYQLGTFLGLASVVVLVAVIESTLYTKSKHLITIYGIGGLSFMLIGMFVDFEYMGLTLMILAQYCTIPVLAIFIISIYLTATIKSTGKVRKNAIIMTVAIILFCLGEVGNTGTASTIFPLISYIAPILMILGLIMMYISVSNYFSED